MLAHGGYVARTLPSSNVWVSIAPIKSEFDHMCWLQMIVFVSSTSGRALIQCDQWFLHIHISHVFNASWLGFQHVSRHWTQKSNTKQQHLDYVEHGHTRKQKPCQNTNNQHCQVQHFDFLTKKWNKKWKHSTHIDNFELILATMDFSLDMYQKTIINVELIQQRQWSSQIILTTIKGL